MAPSSSSSSSPEPEIPPPKKGKGKAKAIEKPASGKGRNEGDDPHWAYKPPHKSVRLEASADVGEFDWDELQNNKDLELWLVRIPDSVKPKHLKTAQISLSPAAKRDSKKTEKMGTLPRTKVTYDIWSVGDDAPDDLPVGGEEIKSLSCLLPRKSKKGKLYVAPTPIARTIVLSAQDAIPTPAPDASTEYKNPPREKYPVEVLKHSFVPYGAAIPQVERASTPTPMQVDAEVLVPDTPQTGVTPAKVKKSKKRKGDDEGGEQPRKSKKTKT
ncbi:hypothetical protein FB45DRAFT_803788 [Roridomyces roridus]|uniref:Uncharacterized protein n=1 Tax=Roridomyces roridus TaxID=1738132 RepID=A0AAD7FC97_9AGAR|nr:hypothetical protein FB45DRAFT_803788 [Roridomyces roridus]